MSLDLPESPKQGNLQKSAPESALGSALRNRSALQSAPESALEGAVPVVFHRKNPSRALSGALWRALRFLRVPPRALSGALLEVSLFWDLLQVDRHSIFDPKKDSKVTCSDSGQKGTFRVTVQGIPKSTSLVTFELL